MSTMTRRPHRRISVSQLLLREHCGPPHADLLVVGARPEASSELDVVGQGLLDAAGSLRGGQRVDDVDGT